MTGDEKEAENIIRALFILSNCETAGIILRTGGNQKPKECTKSINLLKSYITAHKH